ncbi:MAG: tRNA (adenosine(37)-N6)-threonylcarbamoyltransferase complex dimerization subunit type 1 TsaB [Gemmatimonadetes bacterium]|nr:tRNA (adenosine(37)-N6)-threonylcarbamoyltransferase complex dimerization subunit type 1 TsaB [Gemmatimonadota bacterium]
MKAFLAIETSTSLGSVAVGRGPEVLGEALLAVRGRQAETVLPAIDALLRGAGLGVKDVGGVVVGGGPGSFTGVRIAAATAKGLVRALGVPLFAYSGLAALAASLGAESRPVCALFDARRGEVYAACYRFPAYRRMETVLPPGARALDEVIRSVREHDPLYAGDGALRQRARLQQVGGAVAPAHLSVPRASALLWLAQLDPEAGHVAAPSEWEPVYLRASGAERGVRG